MELFDPSQATEKVKQKEMKRVMQREEWMEEDEGVGKCLGFLQCEVVRW